MIETKVSSTKKEVIIGNGRPTILIGGRINPKVKKKLAESLREGLYVICSTGDLRAGKSWGRYS